MINIKKLFYLFFPLLTGTIIGLLIPFGNYYQTLNKPPLAPPSILFPIMWTIIYILMGISYYLLKKKDNNTKLESIIYYLQLFLNLMWSVFFFVLKWRLFTILWTIILLLTVVYMISLFLDKNKISGYLNLLYLGWLLFATYLSIGFYILN